MTVYLVAGFAFVVKLMLLLGAGRLWGIFPDIWRCIAGAVISALHTAACMLPGFRFLSGVIWRIVFFGLMGLAAYDWKPDKILRLVLVLLGVGTLAEAIAKDNLPAAALSVAGLWILCGPVLTGSVYIPLELCREGKRLNLTALRDTGNTLRDPVTGEQVLVLSQEVACALTGLTANQLRTPLDTMQQHPIPGLKLIPYRAVGSSGFLLGMRFQNAKIAGRQRSIVAAFAPETLGREAAYQALAGGYL